MHRTLELAVSPSATDMLLHELAANPMTSGLAASRVGQTQRRPHHDQRP
ncbi:MAG: hypothetical protein H0T92_03255 [Pyrinomonadaceae bacterium]|nr:hypothetical protein [Pyrinomonadaceae bacterium]